MSRYKYLILSGTIIGIILFIVDYIKLAVLTNMVNAILMAAYFMLVTWGILFGAFMACQLFFMHKPR